jgi:small-conductance mechanosensitive channel
VGDFVKVESGQEGFVTDIGWRSITMRERSNNLIVIPNNKFAQAIVTNYHLPDRSTMLRIPVSVSYADDPDKVERILTDIASKLTTPGLLRNPAPFVRFNPGFGEYSLDFTLICQIADVEDQFLVQHEMRKEILRRFRQEGISIPFPTRTVEHKNNPDAGGPQ